MLPSIEITHGPTMTYTFFYQTRVSQKRLGDIIESVTLYEN